MNNPQTVTQAPTMTMGDIYYVLFRHKWRIILCSLLGFAGAGALFVLNKPPFQSEAKLFIRYVTETKNVSAPGDEAKTKSIDQSGETIINSELQILTSLDLAKRVAETVGPEKILAAVGGGKDANIAAVTVRNGMTVEVPPRSSVIRVLFAHPDPAVVQPVLMAIIDAYLKKHVEIHEAVGIVGDFLTQETDQLRSRLAQTEDDLRKARNKVGVISLDDSMKNYSDQIARIRAEILSTEAELAVRSSILKGTAKPPTAAAPAAPEPPVPDEQVSQYRNVVTRLDAFRKREQELLTQFTEQSTRVRDVRFQIAELESQKKKFEATYPTLVSAGTAAPTASGSNDFAADAAQLMMLQSKIKVLSAQLDQIRTEATNVGLMEGTISDLKRKKDLEEANYRYFAASLEQARIDEALGAGRVSNISQIQTPSPPYRESSKTYKIVGMVAASGLLLGLAWAFLIEMYLDRSVRRPVEVERILRLPLFLSIPDLSRNGYRRLARASTEARLSLPEPKGGKQLIEGNGAHFRNGREELAAASDANILRPFHETLRDRLIGYFERRNLTHKPKLVAVTGLGRDTGVTTTAAGLAGCLSETGDGNVLLVDMTPGQGSAQQFYRGNAVCGLDEILASKDHAQIQDRLYVVGEEPSDDKLSRILPQRFTKLVPKLKASDFDYIIFDMPPVSQISVTPRLAGFMDMVLLVVESEKTDRDVVQRATTLLAESKAHVGVVLNKTRNYVPSMLHQEFHDES